MPCFRCIGALHSILCRAQLLNVDQRRWQQGVAVVSLYCLVEGTCQAYQQSGGAARSAPLSAHVLACLFAWWLLRRGRQAAVYHVLACNIALMARAGSVHVLGMFLAWQVCCVSQAC